jgi:hypothetical protein
MQVKKIAALVGFACVAMAGSAHAALPTGSTAETVVNDAVTNGRVIYISGASAVQKGFTGIIGKMFTGTPVYFGGGSNGSNLTKADYAAVGGTLGGASTWAGQNAIIIYRTVGGSVWGVDPVARDQAITALNVTASTCTGTGTTPGSTTNPFICSITDGSVGAPNLHPDAGVSDVHPNLFKETYNTEGEGNFTDDTVPGNHKHQLSDDELAVLTPTPVYGLMFGVPVTSNVPTTVKFTKPILASIMTGNIGTWDKVDSSLSGDIVVCRRVPGSGTQAVYNMELNNYPCTANYNGPADRNTNASSGTKKSYDRPTKVYNIPSATTNHIIVVENSTSGDVKTCLDKAVNGGSYVTADRDGTAGAVSVTFNGSHKAIGTLSMDSLANGLNNASGNNSWSFRNLEGAGAVTVTVSGDITSTSPGNITAVSYGGTGVAPSLANYLDSSWQLQGWESINVPARTVGTTKGDVMAEFIAAAQDPTILASINALAYVSAAVPAPYSAYTPVGYNPTITVTGDNQILHAAYLLGDQCAPYTRK